MTDTRPDRETPKRYRYIQADIEAVQWRRGMWLPDGYAQRIGRESGGVLTFRSSNGIAYPLVEGEYLIHNLVWDSYGTMEQTRFEREYVEVPA